MRNKRCPRYPIVAVLRRKRVESKRSQKELAEAMGYHWQTLGLWERHQSLPSIPALEDWCAALGTDLQIGVTIPPPSVRRVALTPF